MKMSIEVKLSSLLYTFLFLAAASLSLAYQRQQQTDTFQHLDYQNSQQQTNSSNSTTGALLETESQSNYVDEQQQQQQYKWPARQDIVARVLFEENPCPHDVLPINCFNLHPKFGISPSRILYDEYRKFTHLPYEQWIDSFEYNQVFYNTMTKPSRQLISSSSRTNNYHEFNLQTLARGPRVSRMKCTNALNQLVERSRNARKLQSTGKSMFDTDKTLATLLDSFGSFNDMLLTGLIVSGAPGKYQRCMNEMAIDLIDSESKQKEFVKTQYCSLSLRLPSWANDSSSIDTMRIDFGICLPEYCDSGAASDNIDLTVELAKLKIPPLYSDAYGMSVYCHPHPESQLRDWRQNSSSKLLVCFIVIWVSVTLISTIANNSLFATQSDEQRSTLLGVILNAFDLKQNIQKLWIVKETLVGVVNADEAKDKTQSDEDDICRPNLRLLDGIKVVMSLFVISGHMLIAMSSVQGDLSKAERFLASTYSLAIVLPTVGVNAFFVITGIVTSYLLMSRGRRLLKSPSFWIVFVGIRYLRIVSFQALAIWFMKSGFKYLGDGPMWDFGTSNSSPAYKCERQPWLSTFLAQANTRGPIDNCLWPSWYLSNDLLFAVLTPLMLAPYTYGSSMMLLKVGTGALLLVGAVGISKLQNSDYYYEGLLYSDAETPQIFYNELGLIYTSPIFRLVPYCIGLMFGERIYSYAIEKTVKLPQKFWITQRIANVILALCLLFVPIVSRYLLAKSKAMATASIIGQLVVATFLTSGVSLTLVCGKSKILSSLLRSNIFTRIARFSLSSLLVHNMIVVYYFQSKQMPIEITLFTYLEHFPLIVAMTYAASFMTCAIFETPIKHFCDAIVFKLSTKSKLAAKSNQNVQINDKQNTIQ